MSKFIEQAMRDISLEAIAFQHEKVLLRELTNIIVSYRGKQLGLKETKIALDEAMKKHTNMTIDLGIEEGDHHNACVYLPAITADHPFLNAYDKGIRKDYYEFFTKDAMELLSKKAKAIGYVDLSKGTVHGAFELITVKMYITKYFLDDSKYSEEELASIILHELGHAFTTLEYLGDSIVTNLQLATLTKSLTEQPSIPRRIEILKDAKSALNIPSIDPEEDALRSNDVLATILVNGKVNEMRYGSKATSYSQTACESVADQFTTRHGGGRAIVTALDKLHREYGSTERMSSSERLIDAIYAITMSVLSIFFVLSGVILIAIVGVVILFGQILTVFSDPIMDAYDTESDRYKRIRNDLVVALKNPKLSRSHRDDILNDIKIVDNITVDMKPYFTIWQRLGLTLFKSHRNQLDQKKIEKELEYLASNDLFVKAAQLQSIG